MKRIVYYISLPVVLFQGDTKYIWWTCGDQKQYDIQVDRLKLSLFIQAIGSPEPCVFSKLQDLPSWKSLYISDEGIDNDTPWTVETFLTHPRTLLLNSCASTSKEDLLFLGTIQGGFQSSHTLQQQRYYLIQHQTCLSRILIIDRVCDRVRESQCNSMTVSDMGDSSLLVDPDDHNNGDGEEELGNRSEASFNDSIRCQVYSRLVLDPPKETLTSSLLNLSSPFHLPKCFYLTIPSALLFHHFLPTEDAIEE